MSSQRHDLQYFIINSINTIDAPTPGVGDTATPNKLEQLTSAHAAAHRTGY